MGRNETNKTAVIVGAGPGGLAAAMLLGAKGYKVDVYEKQEVPGGRSGRIRLGAYTFDRGATFVMMPQLLEEIFEQSGRSVHDYVELHKLDPLYGLYFDRGQTVLMPSSDNEETAKRIKELFPGEEAGFYRFMTDESVKYQHVEPLLRRPFNGLGDYMKSDAIKALPHLKVTDTVYGQLSRYFQDERLKYAFTFQSKYLGMSAWNCPGTFTILSYMEHRYGLVHPKGGVAALWDAMKKVAEEHGVTFHMGSPIQKIMTQEGVATGVQLQNGEVRQADHIVIGSDFSMSMNHLFEPGVLKKYTPEKLEKKKYSCSTAMLYLGIDGEVDLPHHSIHFADNYEQNVKEITETLVLSEDPSIYVHNPSRLDPTLAPAGKSSLYVLVPIPNLKSDTDWIGQREELKEKMLSRLEQIPQLQDIRGRIEEEAFFTPQDWQDTLDVYQGATFNLAHNLGQMMALRPHNRFEEVERVWLVGGGTHPGSGLPTIFESARISVDLIEKADRKHRKSHAEPNLDPAGATK
ncbi:NAD(P)/FAD-dependent oxidoreductase [Saccharibacillus sp. JS10]|uniref:phytoene desaturase family protein n=1 Tax=Saccharibacillus sp. JS10 TaxID=2950552 RepID=UPI00210D87A2|nr:phytoene desaturase family protein [Saccharibacillus sp. JS10]MCQ4088101.1 phytoene desaturase family protein [Saccharibacillus sp. JS10]